MSQDELPPRVVPDAEEISLGSGAEDGDSIVITTSQIVVRGAGGDDLVSYSSGGVSISHNNPALGRSAPEDPPPQVILNREGLFLFDELSGDTIFTIENNKDGDPTTQGDLLIANEGGALEFADGTRQTTASILSGGAQELSTDPVTLHPGYASDAEAEQVAESTEPCGSPINLVTRTIDCPSAGFVLAIDSCEIEMQHGLIMPSTVEVGVSNVSET